ncbi:hypothetical protein [Haladaptatus salinisoli]|uniref:hypothetical protein n=1 Tax=Haladaptatus salinisoli TaxID=2884876 RepID=UPI001D0B44BB|nr:hypothetical protein [Haladaptatus salinisoli]
MNRRRFLEVGAVGALAATAGCTKAVLGTNRGKVVAKAVRGGGETLVSAGPEGVTTRDDYPSNASAGNVSVSGETAKELRRTYGNPTYEVTIDHYRVAWPNDAEEGGRKRYTTYRSLFNRIRVGDSVTFQPEPTNTDVISSVSCIAPDRESLSVRCSTGNKDGAPI